MKEPTFIDLRVRVNAKNHRLLIARFRHHLTARHRAWYHVPGRHLLDAGVGPWFAPTVDVDDSRYRDFTPTATTDRHIAVALAEYFGELSQPDAIADLSIALATAKTMTLHPHASARTATIVAELRHALNRTRTRDYAISTGDRARLRTIITKLTDHANAAARTETLGVTT